MKKVKWTAFVLALCLLLNLIPNFAYAQELVYGDYMYTVKDDGLGVTITKYNGSESEIIVPSAIDNLPVTVIGEKAFYNNSSITSVTFPLTVERLESSNFCSCSNLLEVKGIDNVKYLGSDCFNYSTKLSYIPQLKKLEIISDYCFNNCKALMEFTIYENVSTISGHAFLQSNTVLTVVDNSAYFKSIDGVVYDKDLTTLVKCSANVTKIELPDTVETFGYRCCSYCQKLKEIVGGENVKTISDKAFEFCKLLDAKCFSAFTSLETVEAQAFVCGLTGEFVYPKTAINLETESFYGMYITKLVVPGEVKNVYPFDYANYLTEVVLEEGVERLYSRCFRGCNRLKKVSLPNTLTQIDSEAFACSLPSIYIPSSVTKIGKKALGYKYDKLNFTYTLNQSFIIFGHSSSQAETYAEEQNLQFYDVESLFNIEALGGSVKVTNPAGLRFGFKLNETALALTDFDDCELGFIYRYGSKNDDLTLENVGTNSVRKRVAVNTLDNGGNTTYNLLFTNIPETAYDSDVSVRAYAVIGGFTYYSVPITRNAREVAIASCNDESNSIETINKIKEIYGV